MRSLSAVRTWSSWAVRPRLCCCVPGRGRRALRVGGARRPAARRRQGSAPEGTSGFSVEARGLLRHAAPPFSSRLVVDDLGVHHVVLGLGLVGTGAGARGTAPRPGGLASAYMAWPSFWRDGRDLLGGRADLGGVLALELLLQLLDRGLDLGLDVAGDLVLVVLEELLRLVDELLALVADLGGLAALVVLVRVLLGLLRASGRPRPSAARSRR